MAKSVRRKSSSEVEGKGRRVSASAAKPKPKPARAMLYDAEVVEETPAPETRSASGNTSLGGRGRRGEVGNDRDRGGRSGGRGDGRRPAAGGRRGGRWRGGERWQHRRGRHGRAGRAERAAGAGIAGAAADEEREEIAAEDVADEREEGHDEMEGGEGAEGHDEGTGAVAERDTHDADAADPAELEYRRREPMQDDRGRDEGRGAGGAGGGGREGRYGREGGRGGYRDQGRYEPRGDEGRGEGRAEPRNEPRSEARPEPAAPPVVKSGTLEIKPLQEMDITELQDLAKEHGITDQAGMKKHDLVFGIMRRKAVTTETLYAEGCLEMSVDGFGFLRNVDNNFAPGADDIFVPPSQIKRNGLRAGHIIRGQVRAPREGDRFFSLTKVESINDGDPSAMQDLANFEDMTPYHPSKRLHLETDAKELSMRIIDICTPIGKGQRMLIVAPPRTGKTVLLQKIANAISANHPEAILLILLVDERPEEVTEMKRHTKGIVLSSTFDEKADRHVAVTESVLEMAKRYVEFGKDVVILMDSITRMARAFNTEAGSSGKILSGGLDANALQKPKRFFGAARALEEGGSLTILGTALIDTNSKMDEVIFEEFKGTGNAELHLDRMLSDKRVYPAIDINASGTRREELLLDPKEMDLVYRLRRVLSDMNPVEGVEMLKSRLDKTPTNAQFLLTMNLD